MSRALACVASMSFWWSCAQSTTLAGVVFDGGVVLGADSRATEGSLIADSVCDKLHVLCENCAAGGCGTAADADEISRHVALDLRLERLGRSVSTARPSTALHRIDGVKALLRKRLRAAQVQCGYVLGGVDDRGPSLYRVEPDGATSKSNYAAMGSGQMPAISAIEAARFKPETASKDHAVDVVRRAVEAGIAGDTGSGGTVHLIVLDTPDPGTTGVKVTRLQYRARR